MAIKKIGRFCLTVRVDESDAGLLAQAHGIDVGTRRRVCLRRAD